MILLIFLVLVPLFRIATFSYRYSRLNALKSIYEKYILGKTLKSKHGKPISIHEYEPEITKVLEACGITDYCFSAQINHDTISKTVKAFHHAVGRMKLEIKQSFFPNTYLRYLVNLPMIISRKVGITPSKSLALVLYILYIGFGCLDISTAIYKLIDFLV